LSNYDPDAEEDEGPVHEVTLRPFMIAKYEMTQRQWRSIKGANPSKYSGEDDRSVEGVSWRDAHAIGMGLSLPTDAQYACRAGNTTPIAGTGNLDGMAYYGRKAKRPTHPVGEKALNGFGLFDMHGNVWEWCEDIYDAHFFAKPASWEMDPLSASGPMGRLIRGDGWNEDAENCRSSARGSVHHSYRDLGLRHVYLLP
jgi:formylglycine-generating enzyme required for sulfatase activity